jgi:hypothetical protein
MSTTNLTATASNGTLVVSTVNTATLAAPISATGEALVFTGSGKLTQDASAGSSWTLTNCTVFINNIGASGATGGILNGANANSVGILRNSEVINTMTVRHDNTFSEITNSRIVNVGTGANLGAIYTASGATLQNSTLDTCGWWEINGTPSIASNFTVQNMDRGFLNWSAGRVDLYGFSAINCTTADGWINNAQTMYLWNPGTFNRGRLIMTTTYNYFEGVSASWKFKNKATSSLLSSVLLIYRETFDGGAQSEVARFTTDGTGTLVGTYDSRLRTTGSSQSRPTLWALLYRGKAGSTYPGIGGGLSYSMGVYQPAIEVRAYGYTPTSGFTSSDIWSPTGQVGTISATLTVSAYADFLLTSDDRITATESAAAAIAGITHTATTITILTGNTLTLDQIYDSRAKYYRDNDGITYATGSGTVFGSDCSLTIQTGAAVNSGTKLTSFSTTSTVTVDGGGTYNGVYTDSTGTSAQLVLTGLSSATVYLQNGSAVQQDYQASVSGTYTYNIPPGATGTWTWVVKRAGYTYARGTFTPGTGGVFSVVPTTPQKLSPDGTVMYAASTNSLVTVSFTGTTEVDVNIGNGVVSVQNVLDATELALITNPGMVWLSSKGECAEFISAAGSFIFLSAGWRFKALNISSPNATVNGFAISTDGTPMNGVNGPVTFLSSSQAADVATAVWAALQASNIGAGTMGELLSKAEIQAQLAAALSA